MSASTDLSSRPSKRSRSATGSRCSVGGCTFTAHAFFGRPGNNPYCHYRALELRRQGLRERIVARAPAPGQPFDHGHFELIEEAFDAPEVEAALFNLVQLRRTRHDARREDPPQQW
jgi:hypothetical protein